MAGCDESSSAVVAAEAPWAINARRGLTAFVLLLSLLALQMSPRCSAPPSRGGVSAVDARSSSHAVPGTDAAATHEKPHASQFSSFSCIAGSQVFESPLLTAGLVPSVSEISQRMCRFRNVCLVQGRLTYFTDATAEAATPASARLDAFGVTLLYPGSNEQRLDRPEGGMGRGKGGGPWGAGFTPDVRSGPIPTTLAWSPRDRVHLLGSLTFAFHYGHVLLDTIMPAFAAAQMYDFDVSRVQLVNLQTCHHVSQGMPHQLERCFQNMNNWPSLFFQYPLITKWDTPDMCFGDLIAGHEPTFGLSSQYLHRATLIRDMRRRLYVSMGLAPNPPPPRTHAVVVLIKRVENTPTEVPTLCNDTLTLAATLRPPPFIQCLVPAEMTVEEQIQLLQRTSLLVVEHGSTAYLSMFSLPGSSMIVVAPDGAPNSFKEPQVLLFNIDVQAWYFTQPQMVADGANAMRLALRRTGENWGIPGTY